MYVNKINVKIPNFKKKSKCMNLTDFYNYNVLFWYYQLNNISSQYYFFNGCLTYFGIDMGGN